MSKYINLINELSDLDKKRIENYIHTYGANEKNFIGLENWLQNWSHSNQNLYKLLGNKLIYSEPFEYNKSIGELRAESIRLLENSSFKESYHNFYINRIRDCNDFDSVQTCFFNHLLDVSHLISNEVDYGGIKYKKNNSNKLLQISEGTKLMRACQKIIDYFKDEWVFEGFEEFRIAHSMIFNNRKIKGELCFSIHPLDFMTMSDNASSWSSCMSWMEEGCYHVGTIEMMNSNCVICCYIKSCDTDFNFSRQKEESQEWVWNNKKWRQLVYVTKDIIMSGKSYPYQDSEYSDIIISKIKELSEKNLNRTYQFGPERYNDMVHMFNTYSINRARGYMKWNPKKHNILWNTNGMYNDMINDHATEYRCYRNKVNHTKIINVSGKATCLCCGKSIIEESDYNREIYNERFSNVGEVVCRDCYDHSPYCQIGDHNIGVRKNYDTIILENGDKYITCLNCFKTRLKVCDCCGKIFFQEGDYSSSFYLAENLKNIDKNVKFLSDDREYFCYPRNSYIKYNFSDFPNKIVCSDKMPILKKVHFCKDCFNNHKKENKIEFFLSEHYWRGYDCNFVIDVDKFSEDKKIFDKLTIETIEGNNRKIEEFIKDKNNYKNVFSFNIPVEMGINSVDYPIDSYSLTRMDTKRKEKLLDTFKIHEVCRVKKPEKETPSKIIY